MKQRLRFLLTLFLLLILIFVAQKVVFMLYNASMAEGAPFLTCVAALWHGLRLDIATACYLVIIPTIVVLLSGFVRLPLRRILVPYYVLIALVFTLAFAVDTVLYSYWGAKPDANDLIYAAQPKEMLAGLPVWFTILGFIVVGLLVWGCTMLLRWTTPKEIPPISSSACVAVSPNPPPILPMPISPAILSATILPSIPLSTCSTPSLRCRIWQRSST